MGKWQAGILYIGQRIDQWYKMPMALFALWRAVIRVWNFFLANNETNDENIGLFPDELVNKLNFSISDFICKHRKGKVYKLRLNNIRERCFYFIEAKLSFEIRDNKNPCEIIKSFSSVYFIVGLP